MFELHSPCAQADTPSTKSTPGAASDIIALLTWLAVNNIDNETVILTLSAAKDRDALSREARAQVEAGLHRYAMTGQGDVKALQGRNGYASASAATG